MLPATEIATISRREDLTRFVWMLTATVGVALLIACANVSNLLLVRSEQRRSELGMRRALGATRGRLIRQLFTESVLLAGGGGAVGVVVSLWAFQLLQRFQLPGGIDVEALELGLEPTTLGLALLLSMVTAVLFGTLPAVRASDPPSAAPRHGRRWYRVSGATAGATARATARARDALVGVQVALSLVLLLGGGLFVRSLINATTAELGFHAETVLIADINLGAQGYGVARADAFYAEVGDRLGGRSRQDASRSRAWAR